MAASRAATHSITDIVSSKVSATAPVSTGPLHHAAFGTALNDRVSLHRHHKPGLPPSALVKLVFAHALEHFSSEDTPSQVAPDLVGLKRLLTVQPDFSERLVGAPAPHPFKCSMFTRAWQS